MPDETTIDERLRAVERAVTDDDVAVADIDDAAALTSRLDDVERRVDDLAATVAEVEAAVTALRGYVGEIEHVNSEVEQTAAAALAAVERLDEASGAPPAIARVADEPAVPDAAPPTDEDEASVLDSVRGLL
ncbi:MAG: hypothetical protein ABEJ59_02060 [Halanaeroarchaeum sp.]